jgi:hypothetical protein
MASAHRLTQLRALVDRLERLPASTRRDWMLQEARSRMVDVETGDEPRPMRTLDEEPPARPPERPGPGVGDGRAAKRPRSKLAPAGKHLRHIQPRVSTQQTPPCVPSPSRSVETNRSPATFGTDGLLWLGESSGDPVAEPDDGSTELPPWRRGLRG